MEILNQGFDHVEFVLNDIKPMGLVFNKLGFEKIGARTLQSQGTRTEVFAQGFVRVLLTQASDSQTVPAASKSESVKFLNKHAEGICVLALEVKDATQAFQET